LQALGVIERAQLRTAVKAYESATEIDLDEPAVQQFVGALAQMGLLDGEAETRVQTILSGLPPANASRDYSGVSSSSRRANTIAMTPMRNAASAPSSGPMRAANRRGWKSRDATAMAAASAE
jgi:hypothetical protein